MPDMNLHDFSMYDAMETEKLEAILQADAEAPEDMETDLDLILYVMEVLAERRKRSGTSAGKTAEEAYASFLKHYLPEADENISD